VARGELVEVTLWEWIAVYPAQRFLRDDDGKTTYLIVPNEVYHSPEYQEELRQAIKESHHGR
jgi:hypothetical protein